LGCLIRAEPCRTAEYGILNLNSAVPRWTLLAFIGKRSCLFRKTGTLFM
jgi:hypothetical protein